MYATWLGRVIPRPREPTQYAGFRCPESFSGMWPLGRRPVGRMRAMDRAPPTASRALRRRTAAGAGPAGARALALRLPAPGLGFWAGSAGWAEPPKMRKMPAASGESSRPATRVGGASSGSAAGGWPGVLRKAAIRSMPVRDMRRSTSSSAAVQASTSSVAAARLGMGRLLAGDAQRAALVAVVDVPHPGKGRPVAIDQRRDVAADPVGRGTRARHHGDPARAGLVVERRHQLAEHLRRRPVDRFEGDRSIGRNSGVDGCEPARLLRGAAGRERREHHRGNDTGQT